VYVFIEVNARVCMSICVCTVFLKPRIGVYIFHAMYRRETHSIIFLIKK
jgi:hypothetical protein